LLRSEQSHFVSSVKGFEFELKNLQCRYYLAHQGLEEAEPRLKLIRLAEIQAILAQILFVEDQLKNFNGKIENHKSLIGLLENPANQEDQRKLLSHDRKRKMTEPDDEERKEEISFGSDPKIKEYFNLARKEKRRDIKKPRLDEVCDIFDYSPVLGIEKSDHTEFFKQESSNQAPTDNTTRTTRDAVVFQEILIPTDFVEGSVLEFEIGDGKTIFFRSAGHGCEAGKTFKVDISKVIDRNS
jgi:hypothetical protein